MILFAENEALAVINNQRRHLVRVDVCAPWEFCFNVEWAADNDASVEWTRSMWDCPCGVCRSWVAPVVAGSESRGAR